MELEVYGLARQFLGIAHSFGEAKRMQQDSLPEDLQDAYAGYSESGGPLFYTEMLTDEQKSRMHSKED